MSTWLSVCGIVHCKKYDNKITKTTSTLQGLGRREGGEMHIFCGHLLRKHCDRVVFFFINEYFAPKTSWLLSGRGERLQELVLALMES